MFTVGRARHHEGDRLCDVFRGQRLEALVHLRSLFLIAVEADERELGLDQARRDLGHPDRLAEELKAKRAGERVDGMLGSGVARAAGVDLDSGNRADHDDVPTSAPLERRQEGLRHALDAQDIRFEHLEPLRFVRLGHRLEAQRPARGVDDHVDLVKRGGERLDRRRVGDVELDRFAANLGGELAAALDAPGSGNRVEARGCEGANRRRADAARGPGDERNRPAFVGFGGQRRS